MLIAKVFQTFCGLFRVSLSFVYFVWLLKQFSVMPHNVVNACTTNIPEGPVYASFNLGQCLNVTLLDLVAVVVSLHTSCNIQTPSKLIFKDKWDLEKNVNYCLLNSIISLTFIKITVSVISKHGNLNKSCIVTQHLFHLNKSLNLTERLWRCFPLHLIF